jgi:methylaspartate mutase sigma subunit
MPTDRTKRLAILASTPDDSHQWNLHGVEMELKERNIDVINLGPLTSCKVIAETVRDRRPDLLVVSTVNGHGVHSMMEVLRALEEYQVKRSIRIVIGGLLTTDPEDAKTAKSTLMSAGCSGVFTGPEAWSGFDEFLLGVACVEPCLDRVYRSDRNRMSKKSTANDAHRNHLRHRPLDL